MFPAPLYYSSLTRLGVRQLPLVAYLTVLGMPPRRESRSAGGRPLVPVYWVMMADCRVKAMWQLVFTPTFWEKTTHGLDQLVRPSPGPDQADAIGEVGANVR